MKLTAYLGPIPVPFLGSRHYDQTYLKHRWPDYQCREERHEAARTFAARQADSRTVEVQEKVINDTENAVEADASQVQTNTAAEQAKIYMNDDQTDLKAAEKAKC